MNCLLFSFGFFLRVSSLFYSESVKIVYLLYDTNTLGRLSVQSSPCNPKLEFFLILRKLSTGKCKTFITPVLSSLKEDRVGCIMLTVRYKRKAVCKAYQPPISTLKCSFWGAYFLSLSWSGAEYPGFILLPGIKPETSRLRPVSNPLVYYDFVKHSYPKILSV